MTLDTLTEESPLLALGAELRRQMETKRDVMADTRRVSFETNGHDPQGDVPLLSVMLNIDMPDGTEAFKVTRHAQQQIATHTGIPWKLYERLLEGHTDGRGKRKAPQPDLLANLANGLLAREPSTRMLRTMDGKVRAFLSNRYRPRDNWDLLDGAILPVLREFPGTVEFKSCDLTETRLYVKIVLPDLEKPVTPKPGDVIRGGVIFQNSEVGVGKTLVAPFTDRLICTNGMVHTEYGQGQRHVGRRIVSDEGEEAWDLYSDETLKLDDEAFYAKVKDTLRGVLNESVFDRIVADMRDLEEIKIAGDPVATVEVIAKRHGFTEGEQGSMLAALIDEGNRSAWGYVNAITRTARDLDNADRQTELETLAGSLVSDREWALTLAA